MAQETNLSSSREGVGLPWGFLCSSAESEVQEVFAESFLTRLLKLPG